MSLQLCVRAVRGRQYISPARECTQAYEPGGACCPRPLEHHVYLPRTRSSAHASAAPLGGRRSTGVNAWCSDRPERASPSCCRAGPCGARSPHAT